MKFSLIFLAFYLIPAAQADTHFSSPYVRDRPAFSSQADATLLEIKKEQPGRAKRAELKRDCPLANAYAQKLLQKITEKNNLAPFMQSAYGPSVVVFCRGRYGNSVSRPDGVIELAGGEFLITDDEDELAFILAHEFSHLSMAHFEMALAKSDGLIIDDKGLNNVTVEYEADGIGLQILRGAGFDPKAAYDSLRNVRKLIPGEFNGEIDLGPRSRFGERQKRIGEDLKKMAPPAPAARQDSAEFEAAKAELKALNQPQ